MRKCLLPADINTCPYFCPTTEGGPCTSPEDGCGMLEIEDSSNGQQSIKREPKWYEKYYK